MKKHSSWMIVTHGTGSNKRYLIGKRGKKANNAGQWGFFGGSNDPGEHPKISALREFYEETNRKLPIAKYLGTHKTKPKNNHYFLHRSASAFRPIINHETEEAIWATRKQIDKLNKHSSIKNYFGKVKPKLRAAALAKRALNTTAKTNQFGYKELKYDAGSRQKAADNGVALPDGSFPIKDATDLASAVRNWGRASNPNKAKRWIIKRARALKMVDKLPDKWQVTAKAADIYEYKHFYIDNNGKKINVPAHGHAKYAADHIKEHKLENDYDHWQKHTDLPSNKKSHQHYMVDKHKWVRGVTTNDYMSVTHPYEMNSKTANALHRTSGKDYNYYEANVLHPGKHSGNLHQFLKPGAMGKFRKHITEHIAKQSVTASSINIPELGGEAHGLVYDQKKGLGNIPFGQEINHRGFSVYMKPSQFHKLTPAKVYTPEHSSIKHVEMKVKNGAPIASPALFVAFDPKHKKPAQVTSHEGRTRMEAIRRVHGDIPVLVHIHAANGMRARHVTQHHIKAFQMAVKPELKNRVIKGKHFDDKVHYKGNWHNVHDLPPHEITASDMREHNIMKAVANTDRPLETKALFGVGKLLKKAFHSDKMKSAHTAVSWHNERADAAQTNAKRDKHLKLAQKHQAKADYHENKLDNLKNKVKSPTFNMESQQKKTADKFKHLSPDHHAAINETLKRLHGLHQFNKHNKNDQEIHHHNGLLKHITGEKHSDPGWAKPIKSKISEHTKGELEDSKDAFDDHMHTKQHAHNQTREDRLNTKHNRSQEDIDEEKKLHTPTKAPESAKAPEPAKQANPTPKKIRKKFKPSTIEERQKNKSDNVANAPKFNESAVKKNVNKEYSHLSDNHKKAIVGSLKGLHYLHEHNANNKHDQDIHVVRGFIKHVSGGGKVAHPAWANKLKEAPSEASKKDVKDSKRDFDKIVGAKKPTKVATPAPVSAGKTDEDHHAAVKQYTKLKNKHTKILHGIKDALKSPDLDSTAKKVLKQKHTQHFNTLKGINNGIKHHTSQLNGGAVKPIKPKVNKVPTPIKPANDMHMTAASTKKSVLRSRLKAL